ncbi:hypothetical protein ACE1CI_26210 [Aerosakkonemataceae cyanobacterium BLCC-F50]|uniref:Uncharacterized protein n=1 Tax=Floridaenema flaviceps BLCC-F50 TaxID=3153642 RepID=A0ABV4XY39_9CYAN
MYKQILQVLNNPSFINRNSILSLLILLSFNLLLTEKTQGQLTPNPNIPIFQGVTINPQFRPDPQIIQGISGGMERASEVAGRRDTEIGPCTGFVDRNPNHTLLITSPLNYLRVQVISPADTTLIISGPGGTWCNDDYQGKNAGIAGQWLPGTYSIWVGSYRKDKYAPYKILFSEIE